MSHQNNELCRCKKAIKNIIKLFDYKNDNISFLCMGISLIQLITENLLFKIPSFIFLFNKENYHSISNYKKCCLVHTLLNIDQNLFDSKNDLLLTQFIKLYPESTLDFVHLCTKFSQQCNYNLVYKHAFLNMYDANSNIEIYTKELLSIVNLESKYNNKIFSYENFLQKFEKIYNKLEINPYIFERVLFHRKILSNINRAFNVNKNEEEDKVIQIIRKKDMKYN